MTSVVDGRRCRQLALVFGAVLMAVIAWGCNPPAAKGPASTPEKPATTPETQPGAGEEAPPTEEPPAEAPSAEEPPAEEPPSEEPPAEEPPAEKPPAEEPPAEEPPLEEPPMEEPPAEKPPAEEPPVEEPADEEPVSTDPSSENFDPNRLPTVVWLPEPISNPDALATTEAEMKPYTEEIPNCDVSFEMVPIPGGKFIMGSPESEEGRWLRDEDGKEIKDDQGNRISDEGPQHEVEIEPFWMGKFEVTWDEYELWGMGLDHDRLMRALDKEGREMTAREKLVDALTRPTKPYTDMTFGMGKSGYPAICMTQLAARAYCKWLSAKTGRYYRLPTEAEWEYACRAGSTTAFSFGDDPDELDDYAWYFDNSDDAYHKVGQKKPNAFGLYDMHGNVMEWVQDQYQPDAYAERAGKVTKNPFVPCKTEYPRVARGGCWDDDPERLRSAARAHSHEGWKMQDPQIPQSIWYVTEVYCPGFRVVRPLRVPEPDEIKDFEPEYEVMKEYREAQAGKM